MAVSGALWRSLRAHQVYGANTDVGKTIVSTLLCNAVRRSRASPAFLKPVSTGALDDADDRHLRQFAAGTQTQCLFQFDQPVSPHLAAQQQRLVPNDNDIVASIHSTLSAWAARSDVDFALVETAGGVHSPGPNGSSQADLYRPLRLPVVLIADARLGGISSSISAYESLLLRGYDVHSVLLFRDDYYRNHDYLRDYFARKSVPLVALPAPPSRPDSRDRDAAARDRDAMHAYYDRAAQGADLTGLVDELGAMNDRRIDRLETMAGRAHDLVWYPFTQHHGMQPKDIAVIDSAHGDFFQTHKPAGGTDDNPGELQAAFDGSASWWTQGLGHGNPDLALSAAYAAGRYGHVMFAGGVHEPALALAETLLQQLGNPRLRKVFYTDNGSTGMEVAVKMGLRAACVRYGWHAGKDQISILGLKGSYHGDTIGVMDCSEPSTFNQKVEWYRGRGFWFDFPQVKLVRGSWRVEVPECLQGALGEGFELGSLNEVFDLDSRLQSGAAGRYREYIRSTIEDMVSRHGMKFGALIMEPVVLGAGGMFFCDPLFQRTLADTVRSTPSLFAANPPSPQTPTSWSGLPIIFDEVFTGLYRLGRRTAASFLDVHPDIGVNAKLLTGGLVPLCTTVASREIFDAFSSPDKSDALLHGHSYTAHAIGCNVAVDSLRTMAEVDRSGAWDEYRGNWASTAKSDESTPEAWSVWSAEFARDLSHADSVAGLWTLGTVLSIELRDEAGGGYTSTAAKGLQQKLGAAAGDRGFVVHSRVLGNVLYLMTSVTTTRESVRALEGLVRGVLL